MLISEFQVLHNPARLFSFLQAVTDVISTTLIKKDNFFIKHFYKAISIDENKTYPPPGIFKNC